MLKVFKVILSILITAAITSCSVKDFKVKSPNGKLTVDCNNISDFIITVNNYKVIEKISPGLRINDIDYTSFKVLSVDESKTSETWKPVWGKQRVVKNNYNQISIKLKPDNGKIKEILMEIRVFNDGIGWRYTIPEGTFKSKYTISSDLTKMNMSECFTFWAPNGERHNIGPLSCKEANNKKSYKSPIVFTTQNGGYFALHEAGYNNIGYNKIKISEKSITWDMVTSKCKGEASTKWKTLIVGKTPGELVESNLIVNLAQKNRIKNCDWIKPGKSLWDWRVSGYKAADGFTYGLNTVSHKRFIDFASKNNIQYLLIDANWYGPEFSKTSDPTKSIGGINIHECIKYAKSKGVDIILYLNDVGAKKFGLEKILSTFHQWGVKGIKYGFMKGKGQQKVIHTHRVVELCAKYELLVDFHDGPIPPMGDERTYPNLVTREFCHAQADAKRSYYPETVVSAPFINMIAGPLDMTNGWYDLNDAHVDRPKVFKVLPGTVAAETAKTLVVYSGLTVLPDAPEEYNKKKDIFEFIKEQPTTFDNFKVLNGEIGKYITVARKDGNRWFVGSLTNRDSRTLKLKFDFLEKGKKYNARIYADNEDTHYMNNKEAYKVYDIEADVSTVHEIKMAPGGGQALLITEVK